MSAASASFVHISQVHQLALDDECSTFQCLTDDWTPEHITRKCDVALNLYRTCTILYFFHCIYLLKIFQQRYCMSAVVLIKITVNHLGCFLHVWHLSFGYQTIWLFINIISTIFSQPITHQFSTYNPTWHLYRNIRYYFHASNILPHSYSYRIK